MIGWIALAIIAFWTIAVGMYFRYRRHSRDCLCSGVSTLTTDRGGKYQKVLLENEKYRKALLEIEAITKSSKSHMNHAAIISSIDGVSKICREAISGSAETGVVCITDIPSDNIVFRYS